VLDGEGRRVASIIRGTRTMSVVEPGGTRFSIAEFKERSGWFRKPWEITRERRTIARSWQQGWWDYEQSCYRRVQLFLWAADASFNLLDEVTSEPVVRAKYVKLELPRGERLHREKTVRIEFEPTAHELDRPIAIAVAWARFVGTPD